MGAGASAVADKLDIDAVKALAGDQFDEAKFNELKDEEGFVSKEALLSVRTTSNQDYCDRAGLHLEPEAQLPEGEHTCKLLNPETGQAPPKTVNK